MSSRIADARGFTLLEIIVAIIILAVLAAMALPKMLNFRSEAELSRVKAVSAAYQQAVSFVQIRWQVLGLKDVLNDIPGYAGDELDVNRYGFPLGTDKNAPMKSPHNIGKGEKGCLALWYTLLIDPPSVSLSTVNDGSDFQAYRHSDELGHYSQCSYVLRTLGDTSTDPSKASVVIHYDAKTGKVTTRIR